jgi:AmmeMemoRadiSam system protein B
MTGIRAAAVSDLFYPGDPLLLQAQLDTFLGDREAAATHPKALIVPHAGFRYSGPVAASAYRLLTGGRDRIRRVVLLGPAHRHAFPGLAATGMDYFSTPLGLVRIDRAAIETVLALPQVQINDAAHREEHSLEVQLPFLQRMLGDGFNLAPLLVGDTDSRSVAAVIEMLWGGQFRPQSLPRLRHRATAGRGHLAGYRTTRPACHRPPAGLRPHPD